MGVALLISGMRRRVEGMKTDLGWMHRQSGVGLFDLKACDAKFEVKRCKECCTCMRI